MNSLSRRRSGKKTLLNQLVISSAAVVVTLIVQIAFIGISMKILTSIGPWFQTGMAGMKRIFALLLLTLWLLAGLSTAVWCWALLYLGLGVFDTLEASVYFSTVAFTTLGFGDITLSEDWRLMSALMAANGLILFSLNTAFLIEVVRRLIPEKT